MKQFTQSDIYHITNSESPILLSIEIGYGQIAVTNILVNGQRIGNDLENSIEELEVGKNADLQYKELVCNTIVYDIQPDTNYTSYDFKLKGGARVMRFPKLKYKVQNDGDVVFYTTKILFL